MKIAGISRKQRKLIIYDEHQYYDGKDMFDTDKEDIRKWSFTNSYKSKIIPVKKEDDDKTFKQCFDEFVEKANTFRKLSLGLGEKGEALINLYKTGSSTQTAKLIFFDYCNRENIKPDPITQQESIFIKNASIGALIYSNNEYEGSAYEYDVNSMYPSVMRDDKFKIPIKEGEIKTLSKKEFEKMKKTFFCYGIYKCKITNSDETKKKLFRFNPDNYYTTQDLRNAKMLDFQIDIIEEDHNFLYYSKDKLINGKALFSYFVDTLYTLKQKDKRFKEILNCLWGLLCKNKKTTLRLDMDKECNIDLNTDEIEILSQCIKGNFVIIEYEYINKSSFVCDFARMKPFLLSTARLKLSEIIYKHVDNIHKIHTDGFLSDTKLNIVLGDDIGNLRFDGYRENVKIFNVNKIIDI